MFRCLVLLSFSLAGVLAAGTAGAQPATPSRCADCPFARPDPPAQARPLNPRNLPATCGTCHAGPYVAFQDSEHFLMLRNGDRSAPTCVTCHGAAGTQLLSPPPPP